MSKEIEMEALQEVDKTSEEINDFSTFTCEICIEPALFSRKFQHNNNCSRNFCVMCIASHIQAKVEENRATINCPGCEQTLDPVECLPMIRPEIFTKWCDCLCKSAVSDMKKCYCPYQRCSELILNECNEAVKKCTCPRCNRLFCYNCRVPWHAGYWCNENHRQMDLNEKQFGFLIEKMKWTRCPHCGQPIERRSGCRNVKCRCGSLFCHDCGRPQHAGRCNVDSRGPPSPCATICCYLSLYIVSVGLALAIDFYIFK